MPEIIEVLGDRPYGMNETMTEYLEEMQRRKADEEQKAAEDAAAKDEDVEKSADGELDEEVKAAQSKMEEDLSKSDGDASTTTNKAENKEDK